MTRNLRVVPILAGMVMVLLLVQVLSFPAWAACTTDQVKPQVVIVGGGLAGLITAYELQNRGITAQVLEAGDRWGGRVATTVYNNGLHAEYGMHEIWERDPLSAYVKKFNLQLSSPEEPYSSVVIDGKFYPYVQDTADEYFATLFKPEERQAYDKWLKDCESLYDEAEAKGLTPRLAPLQDMSFGKWVGTYNLPPKVAEFVRMALECEVATDWDNISAVYGILQYRVFLHGTEKCYHCVAGNTAVIQAFVSAIKGPMTLGARVTRITRVQKADGTTESTVYYLKGNKEYTITAPKVVVAIPAYLLHNIQIEPTLTDQQWKAINTLQAGRYYVVHFILDTAANKMLDVNGRIPFPVLTRGPLGVVYGYLEEPAPGQKEEIFSLLIHGDYTRFYLEPDDEIRRDLLAEMDKIWPGFSSYVHATYFYNYHPVATPAWPVGRSPLDDLSASLRQENMGLYLAGDYIFSSHAEGAVKSGQMVAEKIAAELKP